MEDQKLNALYVLYGIIVILTILLFKLFSKKKLGLGSLIFYILFPTWIVAAIVQGIINLYFDNIYMFSFVGFTGLLAETLLPIIILGGITFTIKYLKHKKKSH